MSTRNLNLSKSGSYCSKSECASFLDDEKGIGGDEIPSSHERSLNDGVSRFQTIDHQNTIPADSLKTERKTEKKDREKKTKVQINHEGGARQNEHG